MTTELTHIEVAVALPIYDIFTYAVPENLLPFAEPGKRVFVPFGKPSVTFGQRKVTGYILRHSKQNSQAEIKLILDILDETPLFPQSMIPFFRWIADYYMYPLGEVINCALPKGLNLYDFAVLSITDTGEKTLSEDSATPLQREILSLISQEPYTMRALCNKLDKQVPISLVHSMERCGWIENKRKLKQGTTKPKTDRFVCLTKTDIPLDTLSEPRKKIISIIKSESEISVKELKEQVPSAPRLINPLKEAGYISVFEKQVYRDPFGDLIEPDTPPQLTEEQKNVVSDIINSLGKGFSTFLLAGVTGSGKTEVYMHLADEVIKSGASVLVLVPEIALISQMERRFRARFGECVAVLHSALSPGERYDQWTRITCDEASIVIGARSAIFAPFKNLGIIIVDEEHDTSYKQENDFLYNARDIATVRAKLLKCVALLGSATPSVQSYHNVTTSKSVEVNLTTRIEQRPLPSITVVDLRKHKNSRGPRRFITDELHTAMQETLGRREQILIFLNRRGFASFPVCASCGESIGCKNCDITLTLHQGAQVYKCHYCGFVRASSSGCPACGSFSIKLLGFGTEKIETAVKSLFPDARVARMDRDTTARKGSVLKILKDLRNNNIDILVGTQMVTKGHDYPNITLVGIICADLSLSFPDFRAGERTFQLLAQVSGRAGRGLVPGKVILQTYNPEHFSIEAARNQDFKAFYNKEISFRKALNYPPFSRLVQLKISGTDSEKTKEAALEAGVVINDLRKSSPEYSSFVEILGPVEAPLTRIAKHYRWQILIKGLNVKYLHLFVRRVMAENPSVFNKRLNNRNVKIVVDVDPFFMS
ncbi:MAG: primosomal protein N' [Desulfobacteraceae bacterium]|nr:primosomal protein N' [Desulfobacteraceae bacterium]